MTIVMYAPDDLRVMGVCDGPDVHGLCPRMNAGEEVPCWGLDVVQAKDCASRADLGINRPRIRVMPGATVCPLATPAFLAESRRTYFSPFTRRDI